MTTPQNHRETGSNGSVTFKEYDNPVYNSEVSREDEVFEREDDLFEKEDGEMTTNGITLEMKEEARKFREESSNHRQLSVNPSVNYDDVALAENLTEQISIDMRPQRMQTGNTRHRSGILKRRMSRDVTIYEEDDDFFHRELILKIRKTLPLKDFRDEIRARRDLDKFLVSPVVVLDVPHTSLDMIIEELLKKLQKDLDVDEEITSQAEKAFFTFQDKHQDSLSSVDQLRETIQGVQYRPDGASYEESWLTTVCSLPMLKKSHVGIARLRHPLNLGNKCEEVMFVIAVIAPKREKFTKSAVEIGRTFSSMMCNTSFRHKLTAARTEEQFKDVLILQSCKYKKEVTESLTDQAAEPEDEFTDYSFKQVGQGIVDDLKRRLPHYWSDYRDGIVGKHTFRKLIATTFFLYFACLLPGIAFGTLYDNNTGGIIDVSSAIVSQTIAGLLFGFFSGQPMLIVVTTAPLALYVKVIMIVCDSFALDFRAMYAMTGLWNSFFLGLQAFFNCSKLMKYSSRSTEEIFELFIALAFTADAIKATIYNFKKNYHFNIPWEYITTTPATTVPTLSNATDVINATSTNATEVLPMPNSLPLGCISEDFCYRPENSVLFLLLMLATLWLGLLLLQFDKSQFLSVTKREILADYALPLSVIALSFVGTYLFSQIPLEPFNYSPGEQLFILAPIGKLPPLAHLGAMGLGLCLSCLFFVDQNLSAAIVNSPDNKLQKGPAYHWDLLVVGFINAFLSLFTLPWVHASIPHSPLHVKALADVEQHVSNLGTVNDEIVKVRETRLTTIFSHILIGLSLLIVAILQYVPIAVLQGLFLYLGLSSFFGNQLFDRMMLLFTEGSSYPPNHYIRKVPQRILHLFTVCQVVQLAIVAVFGFAEQFYLKMIFPVIILLLLPIRHKLLPLFIERKYLAVLDS